MSDKDYWYNVKDNNGKITVEKISKSKKESYSEKPSTDEKKRRNWKPFLIVLFFLVLLLPFATLYFYSKSDNDIVHEKKYRTFMIYMVGSDLESSGSIATFIGASAGCKCNTILVSFSSIFSSSYALHKNININLSVPTAGSIT